MAMEQACPRAVLKPWGSVDLRPWRRDRTDGAAVGEVWFQRADDRAPRPALLLKLLFAQEALSIQVHPHDRYARSVGLGHGKAEAWYVLSATPEAKVAVGLRRRVGPAALRAAVEDGSIVDLVHWRPVAGGDLVYVPAGTIHAIGPGLVIAEIQQRSDTTFRLFDYARGRELHIDHALATAEPGPAEEPGPPTRLSEARTLLLARQPFVVERITLPPRTDWDIRADRETWLLLLEGGAELAGTGASVGDVFFLDDAGATIEAGPAGMSGLLAYPGPDPADNLLSRSARSRDGSTARATEAHA